MDQTQVAKRTSASWISWLGIAITVLVGLGAAMGIGSLLSSADWSDAVRFVGLGSVLITILISPINGLFLWLILEPFTIFWYLNIHMPSGIPDLSLSRLSVALLCVVWLAQLATRKRHLRRFGMVEVAMFLVCLFMIPSLSASLGGINSTLQLVLDKFIAPFLFFVLAKNLYDENKGIDKLTAVLMVIELYLCFVLFYEHLTGQPLFYTPGRTMVYTRHLRKIVGLLQNAAFLATILAMIAPIAFYRFKRAKTPFSRFTYGGMFALAVIGNYACYNRGAWLALAAGLLVMILLEPEYRRVLLPIVVIVACLVVIYSEDVSQSTIVTERLSNVNSIRFRLNLLEVSLRMARENPLFGVGFGNFASYYIQYGGHWELMAWDLPTPHNTYVLVLTTMGLVTLLPYVTIFLAMMLEMIAMTHRTWREFGADRALLVSACASVAAYAVSAAAIDIYANNFTTLVLFAIGGTTLGYVSHLREEHRRRLLSDSRAIAALPGTSEAQR